LRKNQQKKVNFAELTEKQMFNSAQKLRGNARNSFVEMALPVGAIHELPLQKLSIV
jgi:hypothetical protein